MTDGMTDKRSQPNGALTDQESVRLKGLEERSRIVSDEDRPVPEPLDQKALDLLEDLWLMTKCRKEQEENKDRLMAIWLEHLGSKMSLSLTKQALRYLRTNADWWPPLQAFEHAYNTFRQQQQGF